MRAIMFAALLLIEPATAFAEGAHQIGHGHVSPYAGEENREIKSLSKEDIADLRRGAGWGLAKPAELNGVPGPAHLLELKNEITLAPAQVNAIQAAYEEMRSAAIVEGERYIAAERKLEDTFRSGSATEGSLREMLEQIEKSRAALRYIHLSTHLAMPEILSEEQIRRYNKLRGYQLN